MKLSQITIPRVDVVLSDGQSVEVRGITANDLIAMTGNHAPVMAAAFRHLKGVAETKKELGPADARDVMSVLFASAPEFMGRLLALVNDDDTPEGRAIAMTLPLSDQMAILNAAASLTLRSESHLKKLLADLQPTLQLIFGGLTEMMGRPISPSGIGASAAKSPSSSPKGTSTQSSTRSGGSTTKRTSSRKG